MLGPRHEKHIECAKPNLQTQTKKLEHQKNQLKDMKKSAFRVFAALAANDEEIRKRIIDTDRLMDNLITSLQEGTSSKLQMYPGTCIE